MSGGRARQGVAYSLLAACLAACAPQSTLSEGNGHAATQPSGPPASPHSAATAQADAATRTQPVVPGRPGRVFVFAGLDEKCRALEAPQLSIAQMPQKGEVSFRPGQTTAIAASVSGGCMGAEATGTGVYYTAREGTSGSDTFTVSARLASGETMTRQFQVQIAP